MTARTLRILFFGHSLDPVNTFRILTTSETQSLIAAAELLDPDI